MKAEDKGLIDKLRHAASLQRMALPVPAELFEQAATKLETMLDEQALVLANVLKFKNEMQTSLQLIVSGISLSNKEKNQLAEENTALQRQLDMLHGRPFSERDYGALHSQVKELEEETAAQQRLLAKARAELAERDRMILEQSTTIADLRAQFNQPPPIRPTNTGTGCADELRRANKPAPRTCPECGLGPCWRKFT